jgi:tetratricopeptide (TPR) repeat protein
MQKHPIMLQLLKNDELLPCLEISYELLNMAVDFNSMKFLCLLIDFIGNICLYAQDFGRSTFFFEQLRLACSYSKNYKLKVDALIGLAKNATSLKMYKESHIILKKALQYAWAVANEDKELLIYDMMGISYYYMGQLKKAEYFHSRFVLGKLELSSSATKSISFEILNDYHQHLQVVETENLTTLFL